MGYQTILNIRSRTYYPLHYALPVVPTRLPGPTGYLLKLLPETGIRVILWLNTPGGKPDELGNHHLPLPHHSGREKFINSDRKLARNVGFMTDLSRGYLARGYASIRNNSLS